MERILIKGMDFQTPDGKQVLFNGINVVCKDRAQGYIFPDLDKSFRAFERMGFNLIRFGIFWDGVEPEPGKYDMDYLSRVRDAIGLAEKYGLYVIVDMHQDLFARKFMDGAPDWATLDEGAYHPEGCTMWYDAYLQSEAIIRAADNFWADKAVEDGMGVLTHYEKMWEQIAQYLDGCENIIGWEPMNEPFMGSLARNAFGFATERMKERNPQFDLAHPEKISLEEQAAFMEIVTEQFQEFDRTTLMDFYRRMHKAVKKHSEKPLVTGGNIYCSSTVCTGIGRLSADKESQGCQIYAPHGYDSVVDSDRYESFSRENVERLYADKRRSQMELQLPLIVGEWGAFPSKPFTNGLIRHMNGILETRLWSSAYWDYQPKREEDENFSSLCRAYPAETAGRLMAYHYDEEGKAFEMTFEAAEGESRIYCPFIPQSVEGRSGDKACETDYRLEKTGEEACHVLLKTKQTGILTVFIRKER